MNVEGEGHVLVSGVRLAVQRHTSGRGSGRPVLVFLHDSLGCITAWRDFPLELGREAGCDVLVYDRQGHGRSDPFDPAPRRADYLHREADILHTLLQAEGIDRAHLFGHSDGGTIALLAAVRSPARISAVITEGAHVFVEEETLNGIKAAERAFATTDLRQRLIRHHGDRTDALFHAWTKTWRAPFFRDWNIVEELANVRCPVLALQGVDDPFGTAAQVDAIVEAVAGESRKYLIPGAAHTPHKETPGITRELAVNFLGSGPVIGQ